MTLTLAWFEYFLVWMVIGHSSQVTLLTKDANVCTVPTEGCLLWCGQCYGVFIVIIVTFTRICCTVRNTASDLLYWLDILSCIFTKTMRANVITFMQVCEGRFSGTTKYLICAHIHTMHVCFFLKPWKFWEELETFTSIYCFDIMCVCVCACVLPQVRPSHHHLWDDVCDDWFA